ncbi:MAG: NosD domain-containing protein [Candidatus Kariarchaeaceae archaeon]|jgi:parallel beta-helix repeat protein
MSANSYLPFRIPKFCIVFLLLIILTISQTQNEELLSQNVHDQGNNDLISSRSKLSSYISSDPIIISGDSDFDTKAGIYGWSGNGNYSNPYIIENLQIVNNTNNSYGISITSVSKYFIIRNNYIEMTGISSTGIELTSTSNVGTIHNNIINNNTRYGIYLYNSNNVTVTYNEITDNQNAGLHTYGSSQNTIHYNKFSLNDDGIYLRNSNFNSLMHNNISSNTAGIFHSTGTRYNTYYNNTFNYNVNYHINSHPDFEYNIISYNTFNGSGSNFYFQGNADHNLIYRNNFTNNNGGIRFTSFPTNFSIYENLFIDNEYGIWGAIGSTWVYNNTFIGNDYGIHPISSNKGLFENNTLIDNNYGIFVSSSDNGTFMNNTLINNNYAFRISSGENNTLVDNNIISNTYGVYFVSLSYNNTFYGNNFLHNSIQGTGGDASNKADNGSFGNFWLDYMSTAVDSNSDGIGDSSYTFSSVVDNYPLMIWNNENLPLEIVNKNNDVSYNEGDPAFNLTWRAIDESPSKYVIYENGSNIKNGSWTSFETVYVTLSGLMLGNYNYTIVFNDTDNNFKTDTVIVTVYDITPPSINGSVSYTYMEETIGHEISWNVTDNHPDKYYVLKDSVNIQNSTWIANSAITVDVTGLLKNNYTYTLYVNDTSNNINSFSTSVSVFDGTPPDISDYGNQTIEGGDSNETVDWNATDNYPAYYQLYRDGVLIATNTWTSNINISAIIDSSTLGLYNYSIIVFDESGNNMTNTIFINIVDTTSPVILTKPDNVTFYSGILGHDLNWTAFDLYPANYSIILNSSLYLNGDWTNNQISINVDNFTIGLNNLTIIFKDTSGNNVYHSVWITVLKDDVSPIFLEQPENVTYQNITTNNVISWKTSDNVGAGNYSLYLNSILTLTDYWFNNTLLEINIDNLPVGIHNITIIFNDTTGNILKDTIWVTVFADTKSPTIIVKPTNKTYLLGETGNAVSWTAIDDINPANYSVFINGLLVETNFWFNNTAVNISLDGLLLGVSNITISFSDTSGNSVSHSILVEVTNNSKPVISIFPSGPTTINYSQMINLTWQAYDLEPSNYTIYVNNGEVLTNTWINNSLINFTFIDNNLGVYNISIVFRDSTGFVNEHYIMITVVDDINPVLATFPTSNILKEFDEDLNLVWEAHDYSPSNYTIYVDNKPEFTTNWTNSSQATFDAKPLSFGDHNITIVFLDVSGNSISHEINVVVQDTTPPNLTIPGDLTFTVGSLGQYNLTWTVADNFNGTYTIFQNGTLVKTGTWNGTDSIYVDVALLTEGYYNYTLVVSDFSGNINTSMVKVNVLNDGLTEPPVSTSSASTVSTSSASSGSTTSEFSSSRDTSSSSSSSQPISSGFDFVFLLISLIVNLSILSILRFRRIK